MKRILITGATGFVGEAVAKALTVRGHQVRIATRGNGVHLHSGVSDIAVVGAINDQTDWGQALHGTDTVIHLAGLVPSPATRATDFQTVNALATQNLAAQCLSRDITTFLYASSIGAVTASEADQIIDDTISPRPVTPYGVSKLAGEAALGVLSQGRCVVSLRPPLVYGADAGGTWAQLQRLVDGPWPLPFGAVHNRRTMISVDNLASAFVAALDGARAEHSGSYVVGDDQTVSLRQIAIWLRQAMGRPTRLVPVPSRLLRAPLDLSGRAQMAGSLFGDLIVDSHRFKATFRWTPPETTEAAIAKSGAGFRQARATRR